MTDFEIPRSMSYQDLRADGMTRESIRVSVGAGHLFHARRDVYVRGDCSDRVLQSARVGGRADCVSMMRELGVYVLADENSLHVQIPRHRSRLRSPRSRGARLDGTAHRVVVHWRDDPSDADSLIADPVHAVAQAVLCQEVRPAIATLDSALNKGVIAEHQIDALFELIPLNRHAIRRAIDGRAEAGPETFARLICRTFGVSVELQVRIAGVGRVDLVVDGWIIVECDSRAFHGGWDLQERDRRRDLAAAEQGYTTLRPTANHLVWEPGLLLRAVAGLLDRGPRQHDAVISRRRRRDRGRSAIRVMN
ncbi:hypothetical protein [Microbacterium karelineae]|uniref:hypothetical protein n=1 Tax=Microbacterium karelineae TaxID=2654283 RepID=UPI0012EA02F4|nr:hypothetical protein [Microbacterium karelineae]